MANLFEYEAPGEGAERLDVLLQRGPVRIERIVSRHAGTDWYDQVEDEWVALLEGTAELQIEDEIVHLKRGSTLLLKAHTRHRVLSTSENALWLALFMKL